MSKGETNKFFDMLDKNKDGVLSGDEFKKAKIDKAFVEAYLIKATPKAKDAPQSNPDFQDVEQTDDRTTEGTTVENSDAAATASVEAPPVEFSAPPTEPYAPIV